MQKFGFLAMSWLRLLCRAAFICNLCFILALAILRFKRPLNENQELSSVILVMGFFLAVVLNAIVCGWILIRRLLKRPVAVPPPLFVINGAFFVVQLLFLFR